MAQDTIDKIINIQFKYSELIEGITKTDGAISQVKKEIATFKADIKEFERDLKRGAISQDEYNRKMADYGKTLREDEQILKALSDQRRQYSKELQNNIKIETKAAGSVDQLKASIANLTVKYDALGKAEQKSPFGRQLAAKIRAQQEAYNQAKAELGDYRAQVGSYEESITRALGVNTKWISSLKSLATPLGALIGIVAGGVGVFKLFKASINSTQTTGDTMRTEVAGWTNAWELFKKSVATVDFSLFITNATEAIRSGRELAQVLDAVFERTNSTKIQRAMMSEENEILREALNNTTLSYKAREEAGEKYMANLKSIYDQEVQIAWDTKEAWLDATISTINTEGKLTEERKAQKKQELENFITEYNNNRDLIRQANEYLLAIDRLNRAESMLASSPMEAKLKAGEIEAAQKQIAQFSDQVVNYSRIVKEYNLTNDKQVKGVVDSIVQMANAESAYLRENRRVTNTINSNRNAAIQERKQAAKTQLDLGKQLSKSTLDLRQEGLEKDLELSRMRFAWERQELENKLKYDKTLTTESREAINQLILNMEERRYKEESEIRQRWSDKEFEEEARNAENRIRMRLKVQGEMDKLAGAQVKNKNYAGLNSGIQSEELKARQAIADEELRQAQQNLETITNMTEDEWSVRYESLQQYEIARLDAENRVQDAIRTTTRLAVQGEIDQLTATQDMIGGLRGLLGAFGSEFEGFAIAQQVLAVTQAIIDAQKATMAAMASSMALPPIAREIAFAKAKSMIDTQLGISLATIMAQTIPSFFSEGGLVTGPGTGTSDSIPARLSNGEAVMTARAVNDWGAMLSAMNVASGGNAIQVSNLPQRNDGMRGMKAMFREAMLEMPSPIVSVVDIDKGQKRVKVQNSLGKLGRKKIHLTAGY